MSAYACVCGVRASFVDVISFIRNEIHIHTQYTMRAYCVLAYTMYAIDRDVTLMSMKTHDVNELLE